MWQAWQVMFWSEKVEFCHSLNVVCSKYMSPVGSPSKSKVCVYSEWQAAHTSLERK